MREVDKGQEYRDIHVKINALRGYKDYGNLQESIAEQRYQRRVVELDMRNHSQEEILKSLIIAATEITKEMK